LAVWTVENFDRTVDAHFLQLAWHSLVLATVASLLAVVLATTIAYGHRLRPSRTKQLAMRVVGMGYAIPGAVVAVGVLLPFAWIDNSVDAWLRASFGISSGLLLSGTLFAVIFAYLVRFLAVSLGTVEASLGRVTSSMDGAARTLGAGTVGTLRRVHAPIMWPSLLTAGLLVFVDVMKELPATLIIRPFNFDTLAIRAFELASDEQLAESASAALAIVLVGIAPVIVLSRAIARARPGVGGNG
jgi:iron(III) transport system permease protein